MKKYLLSLLLFVPAVVSAQEELDKVGTEVPAKVSFKDGKLTFRSKDDRFKLWFDNRVYIDGSVYAPVDDADQFTTKPNKDLEDDDGQFRFSNGISIRRARFGMKATLYEKWFAEFDVDLAYNEVELKDMYLGYHFNDHFSIKAGHFKEPMSMERVTSSKYLTSLERPMVVDAFAGGRRLGVAATGWGNHWWASGGFFTQQVDLMQKERNRGNDGYGFTGRVAVSPVATEDMTIHVGGYASYRTPEANGTEDGIVEFRTFPESRTDRRRFVRAELTNVNHYYVLGYELGFRYRKFLTYGEYMFTSVDRFRRGTGQEKIGLKNATFNGWYATASYMLLGDQRHYAPDDAEFGPMNVRKKGGNLEVAGRVSTINMNDFHDASAVITGGKAWVWSASLNWYPIRNVLIGLNYSFVNNDKFADDKGHIKKDGQPLSKAHTDGIDFSVFQTRVLVSF
ncbi:MAG: OprO/OprP family phosphate-selective porin [Prevotella sp.]